MAIGRPLSSESGLILINKPRGITSFGVVSRLRKLTGVRRIGHTGTLDPFADGLLPVCIGRATAIVQFMDGYDKTYRLGIEFGRATNTQDLTGITVFEHTLTESEKADLRATDFAVLRQAVAALPGEHDQMPPMFSAVKIDGRPLYEYARRGEEMERKSRRIRIDQAIIESIELDDVLRAVIVIACSKGTYIRTIADELGKLLGFGAHAVTLTRLKCGPFLLEQAVDIEQLFAWREEYPDQAAFVAFLRESGWLTSIDRAFSEFPSLNMPAQTAIRLINGQPLVFDKNEIAAWTDQIPEMDTRTVIYSNGCLIGIASLKPESFDKIQIKTERVLIDLEDFRQS